MYFMAPRRLFNQRAAARGVKNFAYLFQDADAGGGSAGSEDDVFIYTMVTYRIYYSPSRFRDWVCVWLTATN